MLHKSPENDAFTKPSPTRIDRPHQKRAYTISTYIRVFSDLGLPRPLSSATWLRYRLADDRCGYGSITPDAVFHKQQYHSISLFIISIVDCLHNDFTIGLFSWSAIGTEYCNGHFYVNDVRGQKNRKLLEARVSGLLRGTVKL